MATEKNRHEIESKIILEKIEIENLQEKIEIGSVFSDHIEFCIPLGLWYTWAFRTLHSGYIT